MDTETAPMPTDGVPAAHPVELAISHSAEEQERLAVLRLIEQAKGIRL